jgi:hypothetical protein
MANCDWWSIKWNIKSGIEDFHSYLILCVFNKRFKTIGFFKMPHVSYLAKSLRILKDSMREDSLISFPCVLRV